MSMVASRPVLVLAALAVALAGCTTTVVQPGPYDPPPRLGPYDPPSRPGPYDPPVVRPPRNEPPIDYRPGRNDRPTAWRPPVDEPRPGRCRIARVDYAIGMPASPGRIEKVVAESGARSARVVQPGMAVTQDFNPDRLTIAVGRTNRIENLTCG